MKLSFKFKIATISFGISGALLATFGLLFFFVVFQAGIARLDREIFTLTESSMRGPRPPEHWRTFDDSLQYIYGEQGIANIALLVISPYGSITYQSENAPPELQELPYTRPAAPKRAERPFQQPFDADALSHFTERLDLNRDGMVSLSEFDGPLIDFQNFDLNQDGLLSRAEFEQQGEMPKTLQPEGEQQRPDLAAEIQTIETESGNWRVCTMQDARMTLRVAMDMDAFYADINRVRAAFMIAVPLGLLLLGISGWFLAARAMKPVAVIADTASRIGAKELDKRIPMVGNDIELSRLVTVCNSMLDRLEKSYHQAVRFSADAAHELQTPLTILQGELDNAIQTSDDGSEEQQRYSMLLEELRNLKAVVQKLLLLAHADEGRLNLNPLPVDLSSLIEDAAEDLEIMAPQLVIERSIEKGITLPADYALLNQTLRNMTSNVAKYADTEGKAVFTLKSDKKHVLFTLANTAAPIPDNDQPLLFERFHRVEKSRTESGSGLGLSLAREIARAHNGDLVLEPYADGMVSFTLRLPAQPPAV
jgi:signal transduction histidine kinase